MRPIILSLLLFASVPGFAIVSGNKTIGSSGCNYTSISAAMTDIKTNGISGHVILELMPNYSVSSDVAWNNLNALGTSASNTVTIRPHSTVSSAISWSSTGFQVTFNNTAYLTVDGRPGGTGSLRYLKFPPMVNPLLRSGI